MTIKKLAKLLTTREGLKHQVSIADMTEILCHLADLIYEAEDKDAPIFDVLVDIGCKRASKKAKTKKTA